MSQQQVSASQEKSIAPIQKRRETTVGGGSMNASNTFGNRVLLQVVLGHGCCMVVRLRIGSFGTRIPCHGESEASLT